MADPGHYLVSVYENEGEKSIDFRYWNVKFPGRPETIWPEIGFGYGVTKRWYTERTFGSAEVQPTQLKYQWQVKYRYKPMFEFGLQGFGELGEWHHWSPKNFQSHRVGSMISGTYALGGQAGLEVPAGCAVRLNLLGQRVHGLDADPVRFLTSGLAFVAVDWGQRSRKWVGADGSTANFWPQQPIYLML